MAKQIDGASNFDDDAIRLSCCKLFWKEFLSANAGTNSSKELQIDVDGFPTVKSIAAAYQSVFETACIGGLDTPERHRNYMRSVTMSAEPGSTKLNATHFYLASLLSLQKQPDGVGSDKKPLYTGRREFARTIFTTNFDPLLQTSLQLFQLLYYMTDRPEFLSADALQTDHHPAIHLFYAHGSVHRPYMANTDEQIRLLKQQNARDLAAYLGNHGVIVLGYSGWDDCLLEALNQTKTFANNLYWLARGAESISPRVSEFLMSHSNAYWVEIDDGGNFMAELHSRLCPGAPNTEMLYNPIRPLLFQLGCVDLGGIESIGPEQESASNNTVSVLDVPRDVEAIRRQVIARLGDAQKLFTEPAVAKNDLDEIERQAYLSYANKDWAAAVAGYDRLLKQDRLAIGRRTTALLRRGFSHGKNGDASNEIADYSAVIGMHEASPDQVAIARFNRAIRYDQQGEADKAIADYSGIIELPGVAIERVARALVNRGFCFGKQGKADDEIADYSAVIQLTGAPLDQIAKARLNRGVCYGEKGETEKEIADYSAIIDSPGSPTEQIGEALLNRGIVYEHERETEKAISDYSALIGLSGVALEQVADGLLNRGRCYVQKRDMDKAVADFSTVINSANLPAELVEKAKASRESVMTLMPKADDARQS